MTDWMGKRVIVLGAARQGIALGRFLALRGAKVVMNDQKPPEQLAAARQSLQDLDLQVVDRIEWVFGSHPLSLLDEADCVCVSGGVPLELPIIQEAMKRNIMLTNDTQIFLDECPCRTIGITGSAGKTTTTSLVGKIGETALNLGKVIPPYRKVWVGGNIGSPLLAVADQMSEDDLAVMEISSFQLELMTKSVDIACILNITPNHLDRHSSMEAYTAAKQRILDFQSSDDIAILGHDDPGAWGLRYKVKGKCIAFGKDQPATDIEGAFIDGEWISLWDREKITPVIKQAQIPLRGWHNVENVMAACAISQASGLPVKAMQEAIVAFTGVPHRLEWVRTCDGADWYNDSIATAPERVIAAIHAFDAPEDIHRPIVLLAGGRDKKLPWNELADLIHARVDHLVMFGEAAGKVAEAVGGSQPETRPYTMETCTGLEQAVHAAAGLAQAGDIVLLSPGGTSFDEFRDFEQRGEAFKRWVLDLSCK